MTIPYDPYTLFSGYEPAPWKPRGESQTVFSLRRDHGIRGTYRLHNVNDQINDSREHLDKVLIEYRIANISYDLFTVSDMMNATYTFDSRGEGNIVGDIAERVARRITKFWLKHTSPYGKTGGIFDKRFDPSKRDDFIIANSEEYILKIRKYPNMVILKKTGQGKFGYENVKELDGLFDYRYFQQRTICVLESKLEKLTINCDELYDSLFDPLTHLFPHAHFAYILFTDRNSIYQRRHYSHRRQIKQFPLAVYDNLWKRGIPTLLFSFCESRDDFSHMKDHLITQYRAITGMGHTLFGRTVITDKELTIFDGGETPHIKLVKDLRSGTWREVKLTHKRGRK